MNNQPAPTFANGKIAYIIIPAKNVAESAAFYSNVFGWNIRTRGDGSVAFDDGVGEVSGTWVLDRKPNSDPGVLIYVMVDDIAATAAAIVANGGKMITPISGTAPEFVATFSDLFGNVFGIGQQ